MHSPKVSVVIPVYNVEPYLRRCVDSVLAQTLQEIEIILVDDGSPDKCPQICDEYAEKDSRVRVIHKKNDGLASARNAGMKIATGTYLFFVDSDDWLEVDGLESLYKVAEKYQVDFVRYRYYRTGWPGMPENTICRVEDVRELEEGYYSEEQIQVKVYYRLLATVQLTMGAIVGACGSLYNTQFLKKNNLYFYEEVKFSEDLIFSARVVRAAKSFYFVDTPGVYHYFYNPNSISKSFREGRWESCKSLINTCERDFAQDEQYDFSTQLHCLRWFCIMLALNERKFLPTGKQKREYCRRLINDPIVRETQLGFDKLDVSWKLRLVMILIRLRLSGLIALI